MTAGRFRERHVIWAVAGILIAVIIATSIASAVFLREREIETWRRQLSVLSLVLSEQTYQTMSSSQLALDSLAERIQALGIESDAELRAKVGTEAMRRVLSDKVSVLPQLDVATIVDASGEIINFSRSFPAPAINVAERDFFQAQRDDSDIGLFVGLSVKSKVNGQWVFFLSRRLNDSRGRFMGLVLVGISVEKFMNFYARLGADLGEGAAISLYRSDFSVLTRWPPSDEIIGKKNLTGSSHLVVEEMKKTDDVIFTSVPRFSSWGLPTVRMAAVRVVDKFPLIINLTVTEEYLLANWRRTTRQIVALAAGSTIALLVAAIFLLRIARQRSHSTAMLRDLADQVPGMLFQFQLFPDGRTLFPYVNPRFLAWYGLQPDQPEIDGRLLFAQQHPEDADRLRASIQESARTLNPWHEEYRLVSADGDIRWRRGDAQPERLPDGSTLWHGYIADISAEKKAEERLHLAAGVFTHAREGITITSADGAIIDVNDAFTRITGYSRDEVLGRNPRLLSSGRQSKEFYVNLWRDLTEKGYWYGEIWNRRKNGETYPEMQTISAVRDDNGDIRHYLALFTDISAIKEHQNQLEYMAHFDALTGLPNRVLMADRLQQGMAHSQRRSQLLAVVYLDLDGFKTVNDNHGHEVGDQLLIALSGRMKQTLREGDTLARMGGDEFVAVLVDLADVAASVPMLERLLAAAASPVVVSELVLQVSATLGVAFYPQAQEVDADQLLRQSDQAMYQAKLAGKNRYHLFDAEHDSSVRGHHESLENIRRALVEREFVLYFQPKVNMRSGKVIGAEALIRWQHPQRGLLLPGVFLAVVEDHPLAIEIGEWVIGSALTQMAQWRKAGLDIPVSVNVGARQLQQADFVERLRVILLAHPQVRPGDLELEVLETSALEDVAQISQVIQACSELGVSFALDDFGTGYSSLSYLKRLPVALLKIDQSFVRDMLDNLDDLAIPEGVIGLAAAFRRRVIAEGVETVEHGALLLQLGCELAQGYGIARPMPAQEIPPWSAAWRPDAAWVNAPRASRDDLPLVYAAVEHRAWSVSIASYLRGERATAARLDQDQCRLGLWLNGEGLARFGAQPGFEAIAPLHSQVHALAAELCELQTRGGTQQALARLGELQGLRDNLLERLQVLMHGDLRN